MVNKAIILGNVGQEPETRQVGNTSVTKISVATTRKWKSKDGELKEKTEWHTVELWDKLSDIASKYITKGKQVHIIGSIEYDQYEKDGQKRTFTKIRASELTLLGGKQESPQQQTQPAAKAATVETDDLPF